MDVQQTVAKNVDNIVELIFGEVQSQVESIVPDFLKLILVLEVVLRDFEISVNSLGVLALLLPDLSTVEDLLSGLSLNTTTTRVVIVDLVYKMRGVLLSNSEGFTEHLSLLVHSDGFLGLFGSKVALLSLSEVILLLV